MKAQLLRRSASVAAALVVLSALAAGPARAQAGRPITFGINVSMTGGFAESIKPTMNADQLWEKEINARGGLLGRKVVMTFVDNKSNPETAVAIYERMLQDNQDFIFEDSGSLLVQRESTLAEQRQKLFLVPNGFARALYQRGYKYIFNTGAAVSEDLNIGLIKLIQSLPEAQRPKSIGYVTVENIAFTSTTKGMQELAKSLNLETVLDVTYPPSLADATPLIANLKQRAPDIVFQTGLVNDTFLFARAIAQQDLHSKVIAIGLTSGALPNFVQAVGKVSEGMVYSAGWEPRLRTHGNEQFVRAYTQAYGVPPIYNAANGYARWQIFEQAVNATKSLDQKVLRDYIASHRFDTVVGPIEYTDKGYSIPKDTVVTQFQNGERVVVWPPEQATGKFIYPRP
jgi:branched-chain amino acid transport system substrate-binding protein